MKSHVHWHRERGHRAGRPGFAVTWGLAGVDRLRPALRGICRRESGSIDGASLAGTRSALGGFQCCVGERRERLISRLADGRCRSN